MKTTTKGILVFINWTTLERQDIQFVPMEVSTPRAASLTEHAVIGRNQPVIQFTGGSSTMTIEFSLYGTDVKDRANWLQQFTFNDGDGNPPPLLKIIWPGLIPDDALWSVKSVDPKFSLFMPGENFAPRMATVTLNLTRNTERNITFNDINR